MIDPQEVEEEPENCIICATPLEVRYGISNPLGCSHQFHKNCLKVWHTHKNTCPVCRERFDAIKTNGIVNELFNNSEKSDKCVICWASSCHDPKHFISCDTCFAGFHMYCLKPKLETVPDDYWSCSFCIEMRRETNLLAERNTITSPRSDLSRVPIDTLMRMRYQRSVPNNTSNVFNREDIEVEIEWRRVESQVLRVNRTISDPVNQSSARTRARREREVDVPPTNYQLRTRRPTFYHEFE